MIDNPQVSALNSTIRRASDSVNLARLLVSHLSTLSEVERDQFAVALIMEISAREAVAEKL